MTDGPARRSLDRAERLVVVLARDGNHCVWCGREFTALIEPTTDHLVPKLKGGPSWIENEVAACRRCNSRRGHRTPLDWFTECRSHGWRPDRAAVESAMQRLGEAIGERGGQRRAAGYLEAQRRRWRALG